MKIKTLVPVTYNNGITGQEIGLVTGIISSCNQNINGTFNSNFMFQYLSESGNSIANNLSSFTEEETNGLYDLVKDEVPTGLSYTDATTYLYYLGMKIKMAQTFGIEVSEVEIIVD